MVTLEQVEQLDERVRKVISLIETLRQENTHLLAENRRVIEENQKLEFHLEEAERKAVALSSAHEILEKGVMGAIDQLDSVSQEVLPLCEPAEIEKESAKQESFENLATDPVVASDFTKVEDAITNPTDDSQITQAVLNSLVNEEPQTHQDDKQEMDIF